MSWGNINQSDESFRGAETISRGARGAQPLPQPRSAPRAPAEGFVVDDVETRIQDRPAEAALPRATLTVLIGEQEGHRWFLNREEQVLGRGREVDLLLYDLAASRQHIRFLRHAEGFRFVDMESGNGTWLNGRRQSEGELYDGDELDVGESRLRFDSVGAARVREELGEDTNPDFKPPPAQRRAIYEWLSQFRGLLQAQRALLQNLPPRSRKLLLILLPVVGLMSTLIGMSLTPTPPPEQPPSSADDVSSTARLLRAQVEGELARGALREARTLLETRGGLLDRAAQGQLVLRLIQEEQALLDFEAARGHINMGRFAEALSLLRQIPEESRLSASEYGGTLKDELEERERSAALLAAVERGRLSSAERQLAEPPAGQLEQQLMRQLQTERALLRGERLDAQTEEYLANAMRLYQRGGMNEAKEQLRAALDARPAYGARALIQHRLGLLEEEHQAEYESSVAWQQQRYAEALQKLEAARQRDRQLSEGRGVHIRQLLRHYCEQLRGGSPTLYQQSCVE